MGNSKIYLIEDLKVLKPGDKVVTYFDNHNDEMDISETRVVDVNPENIYFDNGFDFPFHQDHSVQTDEAIQDSGDYIFKVMYA